MAQTTTYSAGRERDQSGKWPVVRNGKAVKRFATREEAREAARTLNAESIRKSLTGKRTRTSVR